MAGRPATALPLPLRFAPGCSRAPGAHWPGSSALAPPPTALRAAGDPEAGRPVRRAPAGRATGAHRPGRPRANPRPAARLISLRDHLGVRLFQAQGSPLADPGRICQLLEDQRTLRPTRVGNLPRSLPHRTRPPGTRPLAALRGQQPHRGRVNRPQHPRTAQPRPRLARAAGLLSRRTRSPMTVSLASGAWRLRLFRRLWVCRGRRAKSAGATQRWRSRAPMQRDADGSRRRRSVRSHGSRCTRASRLRDGSRSSVGQARLVRRTTRRTARLPWSTTLARR